jgi:tight adherence protein C
MIPMLVVALSFGAIVAIVFVLGQYVATQAHLQRRLPVLARTDGSAGHSPRAVDAFVARHFREASFGVSGGVREKLRGELIKAGYFRSEALNFYIFWRFAAAIIVPAAAYAVLQFTMQGQPWLLQFLILAVAILVGVMGPDAYISRRQRLLTVRYGQAFPDLLDLLLVCVDAGLSLPAAFDRITGEIFKHDRELGLNLVMMGAEIRAGRGIADALEPLAERLGLDEARSLVLVLRQSIELGSDIGQALRVFSDDMREKRILRAEEGAAKLPVKMTLPLGLFIFPTILLVVLFPVVVRLLTTLSTFR